MKYFIYIFGTLVLGMVSCAKLSDCPAVDAKCLDVPPTNEACQAAFRRWFYDAQSNTCELKAYSGCEAYGFETQAECNACECMK